MRFAKVTPLYVASCDVAISFARLAGQVDWKGFDSAMQSVHAPGMSAKVGDGSIRGTLDTGLRPRVRLVGQPSINVHRVRHKSDEHYRSVDDLVALAGGMERRLLDLRVM